VTAEPPTIDAYLAGLPTEQRVALEKVRRAIKAAAPKAEECFRYGMPAFRLGKTLVAGFSAFAKHCSFFPMSGSIIGKLRGDLAGYETSKGAVRFSTDRVPPAALIRKLVKTRIAEGLEAKSPARQAGFRLSTRRRRTRG
jgi:uncharacterized protein YdhG (YjbR/CyaY superfamily)